MYLNEARLLAVQHMGELLGISRTSFVATAALGSHSAVNHVVFKQRRPGTGAGEGFLGIGFPYNLRTRLISLEFASEGIFTRTIQCSSSKLEILLNPVHLAEGFLQRAFMTNCCLDDTGIPCTEIALSTPWTILDFSFLFGHLEALSPLGT